MYFLKTHRLPIYNHSCRGKDSRKGYGFYGFVWGLVLWFCLYFFFLKKG